MKPRLLLSLILIVALASLSAAPFDPRAAERRGIELFGEGEWKAARRQFARLEAWQETKPAGVKNFDNAYRGFSWTKLCDEALALSEKKTEPWIHKILVLVPMRSRFSWRGGNFEGEFSEADVAVMDSALKAAAQVAWTLSGGAWRWEYRIERLDASLGALSSDPSGGEQRFLQASLKDIKPYPSRLLAGSIGQVDTLIMYWNSAKVSDPQGSVPTAHAASRSLDLMPEYLVGPHRGFISVSQQLMDRPGTLVHEWFHVVESAVGLRPTHGYMGTKQDEYSYYRENLRRIAGERRGLTDPLSHSRNHPVRAELLEVEALEADRAAGRPSTAELDAQRSAAYAARDFETLLRVSLELRRRYPLTDTAYYWQGVALNNLGRKEEAIEAFSAGIAVYPRSAGSLVYRGDLYLQLGRRREAVADFSRALGISRAQEDYVRGRLKPSADRGEAWAQEAMAELGL